MDLGNLRALAIGAAACLCGVFLFVGFVSLIWILAKRQTRAPQPVAVPNPASDASKPALALDVRIRRDLDEENFHVSVSGSGSTVLGRGPDCGTVLKLNEYSGVSRIHARLLMKEGALFVSDLESRNGTWINGRRLPSGQPHELRAGDVLNLGRTRFIVDAVNVAPASGERSRA